MSAQNPYRVKEILIAEDARDDALTKQVVERLPGLPVRYLAENGDPLRQASEQGKLSDADRFSKGKQSLLLTRYQGTWLKSCPGTKHHVCCNLWVVNPAEGCSFDCTYCYLQSYLLRNPTLKLYTNTDEMQDAIEERLQAEPERLFRICTGELTDSLVFEPLTDLSLQLVPLFARYENGLLELKTKSTNIQNLLKLESEHRGKTVISWSVNAPEVAERDEAFSASMEERMQAASRVVSAGYRVAFHFDPIVHSERFREEYKKAVEMIFEAVPPESVAWISLSTLRYHPDMQRVMIERFPESQLPFGEQFLAKDDKIRYAQPIRFQMLDFLWNELKQVSSKLPIYMCMESPAAWRQFTGGPPSAGSELVEIFSRKGPTQSRSGGIRS